MEKLSQKPAQLRVGILVDSYEFPGWIYSILETLQSSEYCKIVLVVVNQNRIKQGLKSKLFTYARHFLYLTFNRLDQLLFAASPDCFALKDATHLLKDVENIRVSVKQSGFSDYFQEADIAKIESKQIDVFLRFGFRILRGKILHCARFGIWSYHHGDNTVNRGGPSGFWEVYNRNPVTGAVLQILNEDLDNGQIISRSFSATDLVSVTRNRRNLYLKSIHFIPRALEKLYHSGPDSFRSAVQKNTNHPVFYSNRLFKSPGNYEMGKLAFLHSGSFLIRKLKEAFRTPKWFLLYKLEETHSTSFHKYRELKQPRGGFWADPFIVRQSEKYFIFIEEFLYAKQKGHISVIQMDQNGNVESTRKIIDEPHHLSYPFVFMYKGSYYMVPESSATRKIQVYRCKKFPDEWEFCMNLMENLEAVDTTLWKGEEKWWLFSYIKEKEGIKYGNELFLFYSENPLSNDWTPHPLNPIVSDIRRARPAGPLFTSKGKLYRPAQDCSRGYGSATRIHEVTTLSTLDYYEEEIDFIQPNWDKTITGTHHYCKDGKLSVIDAKRMALKWFV